MSHTRMGRMIKHKFNAIKTERDGYKFPSKKEARYYDELKLKVKVGIVAFFLRQVPFHMPGGSKMVIDFMEFHTDGTVHFVDTKGMITKDWKMKKKIIEALYPVEIEVK